MRNRPDFLVTSLGRVFKTDGKVSRGLTLDYLRAYTVEKAKLRACYARACNGRIQAQRAVRATRARAYRSSKGSGIGANTRPDGVRVVRT